MKVNIYLPDDLGARAKADELPLSQMLQSAVRRHYEEAEALATTIEDARTYELDLVDKGGRPFRGRFAGLAVLERGRAQVFKLVDGRVLIYGPDDLDYHDITDDVGEELRRRLDDENYVPTMLALGLTPVVDL